MLGRLRNGVRFAILSRRGSEPGVALLMRNEGGFIAEHRPGERGLAHLIEHIVFHSPVADAPDDFDHLERLGMPLTLPAPTAGSTSWRETNYYLSTRSAAPKDLDVLLGLFRDAATNMTLRTDAVDASRGEVVREMAEKKTGNDIYARYIAAVAPGSPNDVIDAQNSADVPIASIDTIRALYHRLYQPQNMMIVVVGNIDAGTVRTLIEKRFGDWKQAVPASRPTAVPTVRRDHIRPISFSALPQARRAVLMTVVMPTPAAPSSRDSQLRADLMDLLVARAVNSRLQALQPHSAAEKTGMFIENGDQGHRQIMVWDRYAGDQWPSAVAGLKGAMCTLSSDGFTEKEWALAKQNLLSDLAHRAAAMPGMPNVDVAKDLSHAVADGRGLISPDERLRHARKMLPAIDVRLGSKWWHRQWGSGVEHLRVEAPELGSVADPISAIRVAAKGSDTLCTLQ
ncbi:M16 family metallopeptidase [Sphingomonas sp. TDK1]|uniref:M16 family metallopeptidase n=1 Tax=Sphingomonas sp. TDK1 TaxID=453247 RepID=UPI0018DCD289|nr:insulinase family protein [Sphingomonas sp. TDK1]